MSWAVVDVADRGQKLESPEDQNTTRGKFIQVHFSLTNTTGKEISDLELPPLVDDKGRTFEKFGYGYQYVPDEDRWMSAHARLPANVPQEFWLIYEVAGDAAGLAVRIGRGNVARVIPLGDVPVAAPPTKAAPQHVRSSPRVPPVLVPPAPTVPPMPPPPTAPSIQCKRTPDIDDICESSSKVGFNCWGGTSGDVERAYPGCEYIANSQFCLGAREN